jgi:hypothetical protein
LRRTGITVNTPSTAAGAHSMVINSMVVPLHRAPHLTARKRSGTAPFFVIHN